jgi:hypothetical protein
VRFKEQKQDPRTEPAVTQVLDDIRRGEPKYDQILPVLAGMLRDDLPELKANLERLGAFKSMAFKGVGPGGADIYQVKFEKGEMEVRLMLSSDGTIVLLGF